jgi:hypothetical protein
VRFIAERKELEEIHDQWLPAVWVEVVPLAMP